MEEVSMESMQQAIKEVHETLEKQNERLFEVEKTLVKQDEQIRAALKRIDEQTKLTESVHELASSVRIMSAEQKQMMEKLNDTNKKIDNVSTDVEELKQKPARKWEDITGKVLIVIVTAVATFILARIGIK